MNNFVIHHPNICSHPFGTPNKTISISASAAGDSSNTTKELRVCTNKSCRRQGSMDVLQVLSGIAPPDISVISCGCLSRCGSGPNLVILPSATFVSHCGTAARAAEVMSSVCGGGSTSTSLEALSLRKKAELAIDNSDFTTADILLSQAIDLNPVGGIHHLYKYRSVARLGMNNNIAALEDAIKASTLAPNFPQAYICKGDALMAMEQYDAAGDSYSMALHLDPSIRRSKSFKAKIAILQEKLATTNG
ncbi:tetratricopeptide repeat (TPR)-containing protein [Artemisia annua]|uniref:Tetratricopeptide repeat (TPR)-containing protein n=1 Tax=Artemisia annua TaxID=35608 RepID=A0A2U1KNB6_ARTAN|nr:tetratricopeptide repeat (TPR)-containing protein [Artemisia annua]